MRAASDVKFNSNHRCCGGSFADGPTQTSFIIGEAARVRDSAPNAVSSRFANRLPPGAERLSTCERHPNESDRPRFADHSFATDCNRLRARRNSPICVSRTLAASLAESCGLSAMLRRSSRTRR